MKRTFTLVAISLLLCANSFAQPPTNDQALLVVDGAKRQIGVTISYDGSYRRLKYPAGDVPIETGVCTDVVVRAFRNAGVDLQREVHEDMKKGFSSYPKIWGLSKPDKNIDHRRVPNLRKFFERNAVSLGRSSAASSYMPGDLVTWLLENNLPHIGIVSDEKSPDGKRYLMIHNIGAGTKAEDVMFSYAITGHYRYFK